MEPTLQQIFGTNAAISNGALQLSASDLGLSPNTNHRAETWFVAIILKAQAHLTQANFDSNINQNIVIGNGFSSFTTRGENNDAYRIDELTISLAKIDDGVTIDPTDY